MDNSRRVRLWALVLLVLFVPLVVNEQFGLGWLGAYGKLAVLLIPVVILAIWIVSGRYRVGVGKNGWIELSLAQRRGVVAVGIVISLMLAFLPSYFRGQAPSYMGLVPFGAVVLFALWAARRSR